MQATSEGKSAAGMIREVAQSEARRAAAAADDLAFAAEERRLWNPTEEMLKALVAASLEIGNAVKTGHNDHDRYDYGTLEDYLNAARKPLLDHGLLLVSRPVCDPVFEEVGSRSGNTLQVARVLVETRVIHAETKGWVAARCWGEGRDRGDKAIYKALTGGRKYSLAMVLGIYTTDEPENDSPEAAAPAKGAKQPPRSPAPPADSARTAPTSSAAPEFTWSAEAQQKLVAKIPTIRATEEQSLAARIRDVTEYLCKKQPVMTAAQWSEATGVLLTFCDQHLAAGAITKEEGQAILHRIAHASGMVTAAELPGSSEPDGGPSPAELEGAAGAGAGHV